MSYPTFDNNSWESVEPTRPMTWTGSGWYYDGDGYGYDYDGGAISPKPGSSWATDITNGYKARSYSFTVTIEETLFSEFDPVVLGFDFFESTDYTIISGPATLSAIESAGTYSWEIGVNDPLGIEVSLFYLTLGGSLENPAYSRPFTLTDLSFNTEETPKQWTSYIGTVEYCDT